MPDSRESALLPRVSIMYPSSALTLGCDGFISLMEYMPIPLPMPGGVETYDPTREFGVNPYGLGDEIYRFLGRRFGDPNA